MDENKLIRDVVNESKKQNDENFQIVFAPNPSPHYSSRYNSNINTIVIHRTGTNRISSALRWYTNLHSEVSTHCVIGRDGHIIQMVDFEKKAWHAGESKYLGQKNVNDFSIGISLVGTSTSGFTDKQYRSCAYVCSVLMNYFIDISLENIVGHSDISEGKKDPGAHWDWEKFHLLLEERTDKSIISIEPEPKNDEYNNKNLYSPDKLIESGRNAEPKSFLISMLLRFIDFLFKGKIEGHFK